VIQEGQCQCQAKAKAGLLLLRGLVAMGRGGGCCRCRYRHPPPAILYRQHTRYKPQALRTMPHEHATDTTKYGQFKGKRKSEGNAVNAVRANCKLRGATLPLIL
jgi:hypothetical protein